MQVYILADTTYNSLSVDEVAAAHVNAQCVVRPCCRSLQLAVVAFCALAWHGMVCLCVQSRRVATSMRLTQLAGAGPLLPSLQGPPLPQHQANPSLQTAAAAPHSQQPPQEPLRCC